MKRSTPLQSLTDSREDEDSKRRRMQIVIDLALEKYRLSKLNNQEQVACNAQHNDKQMATLTQNNSSNNQHIQAVYSREDVGSINSNENSFPYKLYDMLQDSHSNNAIAWTGYGNSFQILNNELLSDVLPKYFRHNNVNSFIRQLYKWGFRKVRCGFHFGYFENEVNDTDMWNSFVCIDVFCDNVPSNYYWTLTFCFILTTSCDEW